MSSTPKVWVAAKNLKTNQLTILASDKMQVISGGSFYPFRPKNTDDFVMDAHYGVIEGDFMTLFYILALGVSKEKLDKRINQKDHPKRIRNPKRLSCSSPQIPMQDLLRRNESKGAVAKKKCNNNKEKIKASKAEQTKALCKYKKNEEKRKKITPDEVVSHLITDQQDLSMSNKDEVMEVLEMEATKDNYTNSVKNNEVLVRPKTNEQNGGNLSSEDKSLTSSPVNIPSVVNVKTADLPACTGNCALSSFLRNELEQAKKVMEDCEKLKLELAKAEATKSTLESTQLMKVKDVVEKFTDSVENMKGYQHTNKLVGEDVAEDLSVPTPDNIPIPPGKIHIGDGVFIDLKAISKEVEFKTFDFSKRVGYLLQVFFPNDLQRRSLDPKTLGEDALPITRANIAVMTRLINKMVKDDNLGDQQVVFTEDNVRGAVRRYCWRVREYLKFKSLPKEEQAEIRRLKREKARAARAKKAEQRPAKNPRKKVPHESSTEESEDDS